MRTRTLDRRHTRSGVYPLGHGCAHIYNVSDLGLRVFVSAALPTEPLGYIGYVIYDIIYK